jgi:hypothetical protein
MEQKCDTMFDIINAVVKETTNVKQLQMFMLNSAQPMTNSDMPNLVNTTEHIQFVPQSEESNPEFNTYYDSDDDSSDEGSEKESDEETAGESEEEETDGESDDEDEITEKLVDANMAESPEVVNVDIEVLDISTMLENKEQPDMVKIININMNDSIDANEVSTDDYLEASEALDIDEPDAEIESMEVDSVQVEKLDAVVESTIVTETTDVNKELVREIYRKMTLQQLKALVISKGLCSDPSKMKKHEILKILESIEE